MLRPVASALLLSLAVALAAALSGCGEEDAQLLPGGTAREITANLEAVRQLADEGDCAGAESAAAQVDEQVEALRGVDERLKRALSQGADRLEEVVARCEEETEAAQPAPSELEAEEEEAATKALEREEEREEKEAEKREKAEEKQEERDEGEGGGPPSQLPPEDEGGGEEGEGGEPPPSEEGDSPSGGLSPANPAGEG